MFISVHPRFDIQINSRLILSDGADGFWIKDFQDLVAGVGGGESTSDFAVGEHFRDGCESAEMEMVIFPRDDEQNDEMHRSVVEGFEVDSSFGSAEDRDDIFKGIGEGMGDRHAGTDAGADLGFALFQGFEDVLVAVLWNVSALGKKVHQFNDGGPMLGRFHIQKDVINIEQFS